MSVGENIKRLRIEKNVKQVELAEKVGITQSMLCQIERGSKALTVQLGKQIAEFFGCSIDDLLREWPEQDNFQKEYNLWR